MIKKDYILKMIEMLGEMIRAIMGLIKTGDLERASYSINDAYDTLLHRDAIYFRQIDADKLIDTLLQDHHYENGHLEILATLFYAEAELKTAAGDNKSAIIFYEKSLRLFRYVQLNSNTYSIENENRITEIETKLA